MEFTEVIKNRFSLRNYDTDKKLSRDTIHKILEAGRIAPSAANRQPWKFIIAESREARAKIAICYMREWLKDAPAILIVVGNKEEVWVRKDDDYNALETDVTIAMDHMILAAYNEGVGTCWIAAFHPEKLRMALELTDNEEVFAITPLGYPKDDYEIPERRPRKELKDIVEFR